MPKYAAIDIGTNSMRLLLAEIQGDAIVHRVKEINTTRIGQAVDEGGFITQEGMSRNIEAFETFVKKAENHSVEAIYAIATSAVRDAKNGREFVRTALEKTGIEIEVISGKEEAELGYQGVLMGLKDADSEVLVIDIGGGSTEFILGKGPILKDLVSENVGAVRMTERIITTDPITSLEEETLYKVVEEEIINTLHLLKKKEITHLIGIGGTITTLAALYQQLDPYDMEKVHNYTLSKEAVAGIKKKLASLTIEEKKQLKGIHPKRADIIVAGTVILDVIMNNLGSKIITISEYDNLEGLLYKKLQSTIL